MELIYRSTIMKKLTKILCVMLIVFSVFQLVGCDKLSNLGKTKTEGEKNVLYYSPSFSEMQRKTGLEMAKDAI